MPARHPLSSRPLDLLYFCFFIVHIIAFVFMDVQPLVPSSLRPKFIVETIDWYLTFSGDPLIRGALGTDLSFAWFRSLLWIELLFQFPTYLVAVYSLWLDLRQSYLLLLVYGTVTTVATFPCVWLVLELPSVHPKISPGGVTDLQRAVLLASYVPFLLIPFVMTIDMWRRVSSMINITGVPHKKIN